LKGIVYAVGIGPGDPAKATGEALEAMQAADVIAGYQTYIDLVREQFPDKEYLVSGMKQEKERVKQTLEKASEGCRVALISSGDAGVYGMAGLLLEMAEDYPEVEVNIVAGVTAALSGGAVLGAPVGHDFACISLSDLLTPWDKIEDRLRLSAQADLVIVLYNPSSHSRTETFEKACRILSEILPATRICGVAERVGREGESSWIGSLKELPKQPVDMLSTVFIGNSQTKIVRGKMVTPRGYEL